jgi:hypothetical protein
MGSLVFTSGRPRRRGEVATDFDQRRGHADRWGRQRLTLARAPWDAGGDRARARELATRAFAGVRALADARRCDVAQIQQWLVSHRA